MLTVIQKNGKWKILFGSVAIASDCFSLEDAKLDAMAYLQELKTEVEYLKDDPRKDVEIRFNNELDYYVYSVQYVGTDEWVDSFNSLEEAERFCQSFNYNIVRIKT